MKYNNRIHLSMDCTFYKKLYHASTLLYIYTVPILCYSYCDVEKIQIDSSTINTVRHEDNDWEEPIDFRKIGEEIFKYRTKISVGNNGELNYNTLKNQIKTAINKGNYDLTLDKIIKLPNGKIKVIISRYYDNIYVKNAPITAIVDSLGNLRQIVGLDICSPEKPFITNSPKQNILDSSVKELNKSKIVSSFEMTEVKKCYYVVRKEGGNIIEPSYLIKYSVSGDNGIHDVEHVFSEDGLLLKKSNVLMGALYREIRDNDYLYSGIGDLLGWEGWPSSDPLAIDTYDAIGDIYSYYNSVHSLDSYDNCGSPVKVTIKNIGTGSYYNPTQERIYLGRWGPTSDGCFDVVDATYAFDIIAHEYTHGIHLAFGLTGGAYFLHEAFCDFLSAHCESVKRPGSDTWKLGEDWIYNTYSPNQNMQAFRYLDNPSALKNTESLEPVPDHLLDEFPDEPTYYEGGGLGVLNVALYLMSQGGQHPTDSVFQPGYTPIDIDGMGMTKTAKILMEALPYSLSGYVSLTTAVDSIVESAYDLYGDVERCTALSAWFAVGAVDSLWGENSDGNKVTFMGEVYFSSDNWAYCDRFGWINWAEVYDASNNNLTDYIGAVYFYSDACDDYYLLHAESYPWIYDYGSASWINISSISCN